MLRAFFFEPCPADASRFRRFAHDVGMALAIAAFPAVLWVGAGLAQALLPEGGAELAGLAFVFLLPWLLDRLL